MSWESNQAWNRHHIGLLEPLPEPVDLEIEIDDELPSYLADTANHVNCPNERVPLVDLLDIDGEKLRTMVFRGVVKSAPAKPPGCAFEYAKPGDVLVSMPKLFGYAPHCHVIPKERIRKFTKGK